MLSWSESEPELISLCYSLITLLLLWYFLKISSSASTSRSFSGLCMWDIISPALSRNILCFGSIKVCMSSILDSTSTFVCILYYHDNVYVQEWTNLLLRSSIASNDLYNSGKLVSFIPVSVNNLIIVVLVLIINFHLTLPNYSCYIIPIRSLYNVPKSLLFIHSKFHAA